MTDVTISIDRTSLSKTPLVLVGDYSGAPLGIISLTEPGRQARVTYAPASRDVHGLMALGASWQQSFLTFDVAPNEAADEAAVQEVYAELVEAIGQFTYTTTVTKGNATPDVWTCDMGSIAPIGLAFEDLQFHEPTYAVTIPVYPIPGV